MGDARGKKKSAFAKKHSVDASKKKSLSIVKDTCAKQSAYKDHNPFEIKAAHPKFEILGRRVKGARGNTTLSRDNAVLSRREHLLPQYENKFKSKSFTDKRLIGKLSANGADEMAAYKLQTIQANKKFKSPNLAQGSLELPSYTLTHKGRVLDDRAAATRNDPFDSEIDDGDDDGDDGYGWRTQSSRMMTSGPQPANDDGPQRPKTKAEVMEELIKKSKDHRVMRTKQNEHALALINELDADFNDVRSLLQPRSDTSLVGALKKEVDEYDMAVNLLSGETKAVATNRTKSPEELVQEKFKLLKDLEKQRLMRMCPDLLGSGNGDLGTGADQSSTSSQQETREQALERKRSELMLSAEAMSQPKTFQSLQELAYAENQKLLSYSQGKFYLNNEEYHFNANGSDDEMDPDSYTDSDDGCEESQLESSDSDHGVIENNKNGDELSDADASSYSRLMDSEDMDDLATEDDESELEDEQKAANQHLASSSLRFKGDDLAQGEPTGCTSAKFDALPFLLPAPQSLAEVAGIFENLLFSEHAKILERIVDSNHIALKDENKTLLASFLKSYFDYIELLLLNVFDLDPRESIDFTHTGAFSYGFLGEPCGLLQKLISQLDDKGASTFKVKLTLCSVLLKTHKRAFLSQRPSPYRNYVVCMVLLYTKLVQLLFPASDAYHQVISPAKILLVQTISLLSTNHNQFTLLASNLFLNIAVTFVERSRKYIPEALHSLETALICILRDAKAAFPQGSQYVSKAPQRLSVDLVLLHTDSFTKNRFIDTQKFVVECIHHYSALFKKFSQLYADSVSFPEVFRGILGYLVRIDEQLQIAGVDCSELKAAIAHVKETSQVHLDPTAHTHRHHMQLQKDKAQGIDSLEPIFEEKYVVGKKYEVNKKISDKKRMANQLKRERKSARRDLRLDAAFMANERLKKTKELDDDRKSKVKSLYSVMQVQQSEANLVKKLKAKYKKK